MNSKTSPIVADQLFRRHHPVKTTLKKALIVLFFLLSLAWMLSFFLTAHRVGCDFRLRYNEICCVRTGLDPYQVWSGGYYDTWTTNAKTHADGFGVSGLDGKTADRDVDCRGPFNRREMASCADGRTDMSGGFSLAIVSFARFAGVPYLSNTEIRSDVAHSSLLFPAPVFLSLTNLIGQSATMAMNMFIGLAFCSFWSYRIRNSNNPAFLVLPAILCNVLWTYSSAQDRFLWSIAQVVLALLIVKEESPKRRLSLFAIMLCLVASGLMIFHVKSEGGWPASLGLNILGGRYGQVLFFLSYILLPLVGIFGTFILTAFPARAPTHLRSTPPTRTSTGCGGVP